MAVVSLSRCLKSLMIFYALALIMALVASVPMILHVYPRSECLLFSYEQGGKLYYGHYAMCNLVGYVFLFVALGAAYLIYKCWSELRKFHGHHPDGPYVAEKVPKHILAVHTVVAIICLILTILSTAGYVTACHNLESGVRSSIHNKLNADPYDTRGEEIQTRFEDDYKFHRYTDRYGNAFGSEFFQIRITCRSILTDPEIYQRLHDSHYEQHSRYYGYWYHDDLYNFDSQFGANRTNALVEANMAGAWLCILFWIAGVILIVVQRYFIRKQKIEHDRVSMHSAMMGYDPSLAKDGSIISGRASSFQRGGSIRGSDRSSRRDIDDLALHSILQTPSQSRAPISQASTSYGRKDIDDMVINNIISAGGQMNPPHHHQQQPYAPSQYSSRETGYLSDEPGTAYNPNISFTRHYPPSTQPVPIRTTADATYLSRDEVETEIF